MIAFVKGVAWHRKSVTRMKKTLTEDFDTRQGEIASTNVEYDDDHEQEENEDTCEDSEDDLDKDKDFDLAHLGDIALMQGMAAAG